MESYHHVFLVGIKGVAMANLAIFLKQMGKEVTGSDVEQTFITDHELKKHRITVINEFTPKSLPAKTDLLIYSAAHGGCDNPQVTHARRLGIMVMNQAALIKQLADTFKITIAVCGCHGKTTTTALLSYTLEQLGMTPSYLIGAPSFHAGIKQFGGANYQASDYFVWEADEYGVSPPIDKTPKIDYYTPDFTLATNIDFDHPDVYEGIDQVKKTYLRCFNRSHKLIFCGDDDNLQSIKNRLQVEFVTYGYRDTNDLVISHSTVDRQLTHFDLTYLGRSLGRWTSNLFGEKNISNLTGVILTLFNLGFPVDQVKRVVLNFSGVKRRMELLYQSEKNILIDDYAHHPVEIETTLGALRLRFPNRRLILIFQPHTFSRTEKLKQEFAVALTKSDLTLLAPIFTSARESLSSPTAVITLLNEIAGQTKKKNVIVCGDNGHLLKTLQRLIKKDDIVITMGAGDVYKLKNDIIKNISTASGGDYGKGLTVSFIIK